MLKQILFPELNKKNIFQRIISYSFYVLLVVCIAFCVAAWLPFSFNNINIETGQKMWFITCSIWAYYMKLNGGSTQLNSAISLSIYGIFFIIFIILFFISAGINLFFSIKDKNKNLIIHQGILTGVVVIFFILLVLTITPGNLSDTVQKHGTYFYPIIPIWKWDLSNEGADFKFNDIAKNTTVLGWVFFCINLVFAILIAFVSFVITLLPIVKKFFIKSKNV